MHSSFIICQGMKIRKIASHSRSHCNDSRSSIVLFCPPNMVICSSYCATAAVVVIEENIMCSSETIHFDFNKMKNVLAAVEHRRIRLSGSHSVKEERRQVVRFRPDEAVIVGTVPTRTEISEEERKETWWSAAEYHGIRLGTKFITKDIRKREKGLVHGIEEAYARALHLACTLSDGEYELLMNNCTAQALCMKPWCEREISARGLECYTSKKHRYERAEFAEETRVAVLKLAKTKTATEDQLSIFYKEYARSAAIFARLCGEVDYQVSFNKQQKNSSRRAHVTSINDEAGTEVREHLLSLSNSQESVQEIKKPSEGRLMVQQLTQSQRADTKMPS